MIKEAFSFGQNPSEKLTAEPEAKRAEALSTENLLAKEQRVLSATIQKRETAEKPERIKIANWRKAILAGMTFMALWGKPFIPPEAKAQILAERAAQETVLAAEKEKDVKSHQIKVEELRRRIENKSLKHNIEYLQSIYGHAAKEVLFIINYDRTLLKDLDVENPKHEDILQEMAEHHDWFWDKEKIMQRAEKKPSKLTVRGFETYDRWTGGKSNEYIENFVKKHVPRDLLTNVDRMEFHDAPKKRSYYEIVGTAKGVGIQGMIWNEGGNVVRIYIASDPHIINALLEDPQGIEFKKILIHEIAHLNDFENSNRLTTEKRIEFFKDLTEFLDNPSRPKNVYIDNLIPQEYRDNGWDEKEMKYRQVRELWAELVADYLTSSTTLPGFDLAEKWFAKMGIKLER